ncbi:MAG: hypothetical protein WC637_00040 [Victivallales bacterium]|jgi:hypothetical protein
MRLQDLTGKRYGRLTVKSRDTNCGKHVKWVCLCDCGNEKTIFAMNLKRGLTTSCGCFRKENIHNPLKHGLTGTRIYNIYHGMIARCCSIQENNEAYPYYRGKGIEVCNEWRSDIKNFYSWAMANGYDESLTIDRIDNDGNYEPSNCRWIPIGEQSKNTSSNHNITFQDETMTMSDWARKKGLKISTFCARLKKGWSKEEALTIPLLNHSQSGLGRYYAIY